MRGEWAHTSWAGPSAWIHTVDRPTGGLREVSHRLSCRGRGTQWCRRARFNDREAGFCLAKKYVQGWVMQHSGKMVNKYMGGTKERALKHSHPLDRCAENSRPFTIERFEEDKKDAKGEQEDSTHLDTSDYHSATSSDCGSAASSDAEEEAKDEEREVVKKGTTEGGACTITMVPRIQKRHVGKNKVKCVRSMVIILVFLYHWIAMF